MKKSTKKIIKALSRYIGHEIIRTKRIDTGDGSYTDYPILLIGFTPEGEIKYRNVMGRQNMYGDAVHILPSSFTDRNWITYKKALRAKNNELNKWKGKKIKRVCPTQNGNRAYMCEAPCGEFITLISASKHHLLIKNDNMMNNMNRLKGDEKILNYEFTNPKDWILADDEE